MEATAGTPTTGTPAAGDDVVLGFDDFNTYLKSALEKSDIGLLKEINEKLLNLERKAIFPSNDGKEAETFGKSIVNMKALTTPNMWSSLDKNFNPDHIETFRNIKGGPFLKLSPIMEKFATIVKYKGDYTKCQSVGVDMREYNAEVKEMNANLMGTKSLTESDAGAVVPVEYLATVIEFATAQSKILSKIFRIPMTTASMQLPKLVQTAGSYFGGIVLYHPGEGIEKKGKKPSFDTVTFTPMKLIGLIHITDELIADSSINIINYLTTIFGRAFQYKIEGEVIGGLGTGGQMLGIRNDPAINVVSRTTAGTVKYTDLINLESALDENFQDLTFMGRRASVNALRGQVDVSGQPVYHDGFTTFLGGAMVPQLLGYEAVKTRNCPSLGVKGDLILGDLMYFGWGVRQDMTIDQSNAPRFVFDETTLRFVMRYDGKPLVSEAFSVLDGTVS